MDLPQTDVIVPGLFASCLLGRFFWTQLNRIPTKGLSDASAVSNKADPTHPCEELVQEGQRPVRVCCGVSGYLRMKTLCRIMILRDVLNFPTERFCPESNITAKYMCELFVLVIPTLFDHTCIKSDRIFTGSFMV